MKGDSSAAGSNKGFDAVNEMRDSDNGPDESWSAGELNGDDSLLGY